jgi:hypothetical protein
MRGGGEALCALLRFFEEVQYDCTHVGRVFRVRGGHVHERQLLLELGGA